MTSTHSHPIDAQLSLSILFLSLSDAAQTEQRRTALPKMEAAKKDREAPYEEPERWDGMW